MRAVYEVRGAGSVRSLILKIYPERWKFEVRAMAFEGAREAFVYRLLPITASGRSHGSCTTNLPALPLAFAVITLLDGRPLSAVADQLTDSDTGQVYEHMGRLLAAAHRITAAQWGYVTTGIVDSKPSNTAYMLGQFATVLCRFVDLYRLHHALEFWNWSTSAVKRAVLADIRTYLEEIMSNDAAQ